MSDYAALLAAVCAAPDDDTPRLVLADWLDDADEGKRAAFIRRQVEIARDPKGRSFARVPCPNRSSWPGDLYRLAEVEPWEVTGPEYVSPVLVFAGGRGGYARCVAWHRGFPAVVGCTERRWHEWHRHPTFRGVPIEALCYTGRYCTVWGVVAPREGELTEYVSLASPGVVRPKVGPGQDATGVAFPNVRWWTRASCAAWLLDALARRGNLATTVAA